MNVWMGHHPSTGEVTMLLTRCPNETRLAFVHEPMSYFTLSLRYPMRLHLYFLESLAYNHWNTLKDRMKPLHEEVSGEMRFSYS